MLFIVLALHNIVFNFKVSSRTSLKFIVYQLGKVNLKGLSGEN